MLRVSKTSQTQSVCQIYQVLNLPKAQQFSVNFCCKLARKILRIHPVLLLESAQ